MGVTVPPIRLKAFHSVSETLLRLTPLHHSPFPSMKPSPVMLMSLRLLAVINGTTFPSLREAFLSGFRRSMALRSR